MGVGVGEFCNEEEGVVGVGVGVYCNEEEGMG